MHARCVGSVIQDGEADSNSKRCAGIDGLCGSEPACHRHRRALSNSTCASHYAVLPRQMYSSEWSRCTQPRATTLHIYWVAELYNPAVPYAYVLGRGAL